ncbi:aldehyde ferredoxin oxidoreductase family protein [Desulfosporosinus sp. BICA1-9]|uniref:aldehyde ferredoxin oxidoreductase family protein n=1 Tax=Desulfosporosinus sp. BICA1-9 TaxID=1531958 RepID=UPI00054C38E5|nr:aldehyde ferredoxin oxidoreductase family protein [Desulfosporosinus sp. BICA1-9]KJS48373.1 MAG: aldehyde:ferredoxin oxidoreductase [Peptococcaceae bacterium BRH_c23]KJS84256.1 MAG: aldehyde:ferredoxin oxidoreductase [Desulfosporosinus sp. BICA1-9]HBW37665.1 aldehyde ferredoxin oxidoreductase [Desulfosporosinus sp.]
MDKVLGGYAGEILWVDLTKRQWHTENVSETMAKKWIGGSGWAVETLFHRVPADADALGPENILGFFTGPLTGTVIPSSGRHCIAAKSPLTGIWGEASVGGTWGKALKRAGYDALILTGQASEPVYLWINNGKVEIRPAGSLWGLDTYEIEEAVRELTDPKAEVCSIGPAGERMAKIAGLFTDGREGRTAARCGLGAVAGSKKVKAIAVYGNKPPVLAYKDELLKRIKEVVPEITEKNKGLTNFGTPVLVLPCEQLGDFPVKNWTGGSWEEGAKSISGPRLAETYLTGRYHCASCPIGCGRRVAIDNEVHDSVRGAGPEYETLGLFGGSCLIDNLEAICYANELCNRYGIDTIEVGNLVAFSMEAYEKGVIGKQDTGGREILWGDAEALIGLIQEMGEGSGFGAVLAEGFPALAQRYGEIVNEIGMTAKGLSFPAHDPRAYNSLALGYATANRGADHLEAFSHAFERNLTMPDLGIAKSFDRFSSQGKGALVAKTQNLMMVFDSLAVCKFLMTGGITPTVLAEWLSLATGSEWDVESLMRTGERIFNLKRLYNIKYGVDRRMDTLPDRILKNSRATGGAAKNLPPLNEMLDEYYIARGWDSQGIPTADKLKELEISIKN